MTSLFTLRTLTATFLATALATAQTPAPKPAPKPVPPQAAPTPPPPEPDYVATRDFKSKVFLVQHRPPHDLASILRPLGSGFKGAVIQSTDRPGMRLLSVRDFPENVAAIEDALKRLDVPAATPKEVELHIHVLIASKQEGPSEGLPEDLKGVVATLKGTLNYRSYTLATSFLQRAKDGSEFVRGLGQVEVPARAGKAEQAPATLKFEWQIRTLKLDAAAEGPAILSLGEFSLTCSEVLPTREIASLANLRTDLSLKDGEKVVVGTSAFKDKGLIVVVTATVMK